MSTLTIESKNFPGGCFFNDGGVVCIPACCWAKLEQRKNSQTLNLIKTAAKRVSELNELFWNLSNEAWVCTNGRIEVRGSLSMHQNVFRLLVCKKKNINCM